MANPRQRSSLSTQDGNTDTGNVQHPLLLLSSGHEAHTLATSASVQLPPLYSLLRVPMQNSFSYSVPPAAALSANATAPTSSSFFAYTAGAVNNTGDVSKSSTTPATNSAHCQHQYQQQKQNGESQVSLPPPKNSEDEARKTLMLRSTPTNISSPADPRIYQPFYGGLSPVVAATTNHQQALYFALPRDLTKEVLYASNSHHVTSKSSTATTTLPATHSAQQQNFSSNGFLSDASTSGLYSADSTQFWLNSNAAVASSRDQPLMASLHEVRRSSGMCDQTPSVYAVTLDMSKTDMPTKEAHNSWSKSTPKTKSISGVTTVTKESQPIMSSKTSTLEPSHNLGAKRLSNDEPAQKMLYSNHTLLPALHQQQQYCHFINHNKANADQAGSTTTSKCYKIGQHDDAVDRAFPVKIDHNNASFEQQQASKRSRQFLASSQQQPSKTAAVINGMPLVDTITLNQLFADQQQLQQNGSHSSATDTRRTEGSMRRSALEQHPSNQQPGAIMLLELPGGNHVKTVSGQHSTQLLYQSADNNILLATNHPSQYLLDYSSSTLPVHSAGQMMTDLSSPATFTTNDLMNFHHSQPQYSNSTLTSAFATNRAINNNVASNNSMYQPQQQYISGMLGPTMATTLPPSSSTNNAFSYGAAAAAAAAAGGPIQLWQFLLEMLIDKTCQQFICWTGHEWEFKLLDPDEVAKRWGQRKNKHKMNYEKLSHGLRYYYDKKIIKKTTGKRYVYKFVCDLETMFGGIKPHELHQMVGIGCSSVQTDGLIGDNVTENIVHSGDSPSLVSTASSSSLSTSPLLQQQLTESSSTENNNIAPAGQVVVFSSSSTINGTGRRNEAHQSTVQVDFQQLAASRAAIHPALTDWYITSSLDGSNTPRNNASTTRNAIPNDSAMTAADNSHPRYYQ